MYRKNINEWIDFLDIGANPHYADYLKLMHCRFDRGALRRGSTWFELDGGSRLINESPDIYAQFVRQQFGTPIDSDSDMQDDSNSVIEGIEGNYHQSVQEYSDESSDGDDPSVLELVTTADNKSENTGPSTPDNKVSDAAQEIHNNSAIPRPSESTIIIGREPSMSSDPSALSKVLNAQEIHNNSVIATPSESMAITRSTSSTSGEKRVVSF